MVREMMPGFFKAFSYISPLYYSINLDYNVLFGGGGTVDLAQGLGMVAIVALLINALIYSIKLTKMPEEITEPTAESLSLKSK